jgi:FMN phosphatase YigB (HAD superfamily)
MPIKAVCFDLGETLIDETRMWSEWAAYLGVPLSLQLDVDVITTSEHLGFDKPSPQFFTALLAQTGFRVTPLSQLVEALKRA